MECQRNAVIYVSVKRERPTELSGVEARSMSCTRIMILMNWYWKLGRSSCASACTSLIIIATSCGKDECTCQFTSTRSTPVRICNCSSSNYAQQCTGHDRYLTDCANVTHAGMLHQRPNIQSARCFLCRVRYDKIMRVEVFADLVIREAHVGIRMASG